MPALHDSGKRKRLYLSWMSSKKGYIYSGRDGAFGRTGTIVWGIVVPVMMTLVLPFFAIITVPLLIYAIIGLIRGPRWYASRHAS